ncbi:vanadium-dependent haloperoxidase [Ornithinimicrobium sp. LYQ103]|uniref:vanadium-dependent haloperoxidase n=1 Tax=Ornithinimicrobium sp. LYQ103 TaxID=3378796 RepID=UPI0038524417
MNRRTVLSRLTALTAVGLLAVAPAAAAPGPKGPPVTDNPAAVLDWNAVAFRTVVTEGGQPPQVAQFYLGLVSTAVYNAVVTVEGGGTATVPQPPAKVHASSDVAAVTAAHDVLRHYFPSSASTLAANYRTFLASRPNGVGKVHGVFAGQDAAAALLGTRDDSELNAPITLPRPPDPPPGVWVPTGSGEMQAPWLAFVTPIVLEAGADLGIDGPDPINSVAYAVDFEEARTMGAATGSLRSPQQTETGLFFTDNPPRQYQDALRDRAARHDLDIVESARMMAAANVAGADALIACWAAKYEANFWRPVTAIHRADEDDNPDTAADPTWVSLRPSPPYPEYPSGHACISGGVAGALEALYGEGGVDTVVASAVTGTTRHYNSEDAWLDDVVDGRIFLGFHFRDGMEDGRQIGAETAERVVGAFLP